MANEEKERPQKRKPRHRLIVRLGALLVAHSSLVSLICCVAGFIALLLLPALAKNTYISENALMPGSANPLFSSQDVEEASRFFKDILKIKTLKDATGMEVQNLIGQRVAHIGAEFYYHKFCSHSNDFRPFHFFSFVSNYAEMQDTSNCTSWGINTVGVIRAPRGDGKEAIVLVSPYNSLDVEMSEALSLGLAFSTFSLLSRVSWLAKDIVWLAADSRYGEYTAVDSWLKDYHNPVFHNGPRKDIAGLWHENGINNDLYDARFRESNSKIFKRAGTMAAALVVKVMESKTKEERDSLTLYAEASNGQMPNLDLINIVHYLAVHRQGLRVKIGQVGSLLHSVFVNFIGELLQQVGTLIKVLKLNLKFEIRSSDFVQGTATLASSIFHQALGVPTGPHGPFRDYQVDAITLELSPRFLYNENGRSTFLLRSGRLMEGTIRSVNNLLEKFHQSFFLYLLTAPDKFVSVGVYMIAFALLMAPLPIVSAALFSGHDQLGHPTDKMNENSDFSGTNETVITTVSWKWLRAAQVVFMIHLWAIMVSLMPSVISQIPDTSPTMSMLIWAVLAVSTLLIFYLYLGSYSADYTWQLLKSVMIAAVSVGLGLMSIINFSTAQIGAMLLVPMCLVVQPLMTKTRKPLYLEAFRAVCSVAVALVGFLPAVLFIMKGYTKDAGKVDLGDFWKWAELLWSWNSATYLYVLLIHLPCWVLCLHILFYPIQGR